MAVTAGFAGIGTFQYQRTERHARLAIAKKGDIDEVQQSGVVLKYILQAKDRGVAVVFITHNPHHTYLVGDRFFLLNRGRMIAEYERSGVTREELVQAMAGGAELETLAHELESYTS